MLQSIARISYFVCLFASGGAPTAEQQKSAVVYPILCNVNEHKIVNGNVILGLLSPLNTIQVGLTLYNLPSSLMLGNYTFRQII